MLSLPPETATPSFSGTASKAVMADVKLWSRGAVTDTGAFSSLAQLGGHIRCQETEFQAATGSDTLRRSGPTHPRPAPIGTTFQVRLRMLDRLKTLLDRRAQMIYCLQPLQRPCRGSAALWG